MLTAGGCWSLRCANTLTKLVFPSFSAHPRSYGLLQRTRRAAVLPSQLARFLLSQLLCERTATIWTFNTVV
jgi:hypothetical protein